MRPVPVLCFGEVLWDVLPHGRCLGGAPVNVAYHLKKLGAGPLPVTAVGDDAPGREILGRLRGWGIDTAFVGVARQPTGEVRVRLAAADRPVYEVLPDVAWDAIPGPPELLAAARAASALVFGSLAPRSENNRALLDRLLQASAGLKVFDVNLRPPFVDVARVTDLMRRSDVVKLNTDELDALLGATAGGGPWENQARRLSRVTGCPQVCVTAGAQGAGWLRRNEWTWAAAPPVAGARDAVGAGDAFLAALVASCLQPEALDSAAILERACRLASFVAGRDGATPEYDASTVLA